jgi:hypothetical protein
MTKLMEWLSGMGIFFGVWCALLSRQIQVRLLEEWMSVIIPLPLILIMLFGVSTVPELRTEKEIN